MDASGASDRRKKSRPGQRGWGHHEMYPSMPGSNGVACIFRRIAMKTIVSALIALSVLAGIAAPASAMDAKTFYEQQDRVSY
jgi:hypothetical protein